MDHDIKNTATDLVVAENALGHHWDYKDPKKATPPPRDYFVPNFGVDHDVETTLSNEKKASASLGHKWVVPDKASVPAPHPTDYFVPNFGQDTDIKNTQTDLSIAEKQLGHQWNYNTVKAKGPPVDYPVPNFGMDHDIKDSLNHLNAQEAKFGQWNLPQEAVQLDADMKREPLLTWRQTPKKGHPVNYFVPNFGVDHDIAISQGNEATAEGKLGHQWTPVIDPETEKYIVPSPQIEFKLLQTESDIAREPLTGWSPTIAKPDHPMNYFVPNFGLDHDMIETKKSYELE